MIVVKNLTAALIPITKRVRTVQVMVVNAIPQVGVVPGMLGKLD